MQYSLRSQLALFIFNATILVNEIRCTNNYKPLSLSLSLSLSVLFSLIPSTRKLINVHCIVYSDDAVDLWSYRSIIDNFTKIIKQHRASKSLCCLTTWVVQINTFSYSAWWKKWKNLEIIDLFRKKKKIKEVNFFFFFCKMASWSLQLIQV